MHWTRSAPEASGALLVVLRVVRGSPGPPRTPGRPFSDRPRPLTTPPPRPRDPITAPLRPLRGSSRHIRPSYAGRTALTRCSNKGRGYGFPPQIRRLSPVHTLGTGKLSRLCPQADGVREDLTRSPGCGFVDEGCPQAVDKKMIHSLCTELSTDCPQAAAGCPQRSSASPHVCPLFGNPPRVLTGSSERRHTKVPRHPVGNGAEPGDGPGENSPRPVHGVCRTFCSPQKTPVVHRLRPQGRWTKYRL